MVVLLLPAIMVVLKQCLHFMDRTRIFATAGSLFWLLRNFFWEATDTRVSRYISRECFAPPGRLGVLLSVIPFMLDVTNPLGAVMTISTPACVSW